MGELLTPVGSLAGGAAVLVDEPATFASTVRRQATGTQIPEEMPAGYWTRRRVRGPSILMTSHVNSAAVIADLLPAIRVAHASELAAVATAESNAVVSVRRLLDRRRNAIRSLLPAIRAAYESEASKRVRAGDGHAADLRRTLVSLLKRRCRVLKARVAALLEGPPAFPRETDPVAVHLGFFDACRLSRNEVAQTRMLAYFLDPKGAHELGSRPLEAFVQLLAEKTSAPHTSWLTREVVRSKSNVRVTAEDVRTIDGNGRARRLDVVVSLGERRIVVEAKVDAREGEAQLRDIESSCGQDAALVFLTTNGAEPTTAGEPRRWVRLRWQDVVAAMGVALRGSAGPGTDLVRLWCSGILHEISDVQRLRDVRDDAGQLARLESYLSIWRAIADGLDSGSNRTVSMAVSGKVEGDGHPGRRP